MTTFLIYDLKVSVLIAVCYLFYRLLMERDTLHRLSRVVLLVSMALSLVLPLCIITFHHVEWVQVEPMPLAPGEPQLQVSGEPQLQVSVVHDLPKQRDWGALLLSLLGWVVLAGIAVRLLQLARSYWRLRRLIHDGDCQQLADGITLCVVEPPVAPFSWWDTIVLNRQDHESSACALLIKHERSHIRLHHSADVVFVELVTALQWFNPVVWLLSRDLRTIHEYEADEAVLSEGVSMTQYISLLTCKATGIQACVLANGINTSELTKRIRMMIKPKTSRRWSWLKALYVIPVAALSLAVTARTVTDYRTLPGSAVTSHEEQQDQEPDVVFEICEEMPRFPGGDVELMQFLARSVKYPVAAEEYGVQGRVLAQFIVEKDGSITHARAIKATNPATGQEIVVVAYRPDMTEQQLRQSDPQQLLSLLSGLCGGEAHAQVDARQAERPGRPREVHHPRHLPPAIAKKEGKKCNIRPKVASNKIKTNI